MAEPRRTTSLIEAGVARVFVGFRDPNELVDGRGIRKLPSGHSS